MRFVLVVLTSVVLTGIALADIIHLKDGGTIVCQNVREGGGGIQYEKNGSTFTIPKSWVEKVETDSEAGARPDDSASDDSGKESEKESQQTRSAPAPAERHYDPDELAKLEKKVGRSQAAVAYIEAGKYELQNGNPDQAVSYFERALSFYPTNVGILSWYADALSRAGKHEDAIAAAEKATELAPDSAQSFFLLGYILYAAEKPGAAAKAFQRAQELHPDPAVAGWLDRAQRESHIEGMANGIESPHFSLKFQGGKTSGLLASDVVRELEAHRQALHAELGTWPRDNIIVVLYTEQEFFDVTQAPAWSGGVSDGRLHIPIAGLKEVTPELSRVLKHELTHTFLIDMSADRCPGWLQEGIAQMMEPRDARRAAQFLSRRVEKQLPFRSLEAQFSRFADPEQAGTAYAEALVAADYIRSNYGMSALVRIVEAIGEGNTTEDALRTVVHLNYDKLQDAIGVNAEKRTAR